MIVFLLFKVTRWIAASIRSSGQQVQRSLPSAWLNSWNYTLCNSISLNTFVEGFSFLQGKNIIDSAEYPPASITAGGGILLRFRKHTHLKCKCLIGDIALMNQTVQGCPISRWYLKMMAKTLGPSFFMKNHFFRFHTHLWSISFVQRVKLGRNNWNV